MYSNHHLPPLLFSKPLLTSLVCVQTIADQPPCPLPLQVGEEPRNVEEYDAVRSASPQGARGRLPTPLWPSQQQQQQRWVATPNALGLIPEVRAWLLRNKQWSLAAVG